MTTDVGIANEALRRLGAATITSFTQGTKPANSVNDLYAPTRDELLRAHAWNFATRRVKLAQLSNVPAFGFDHAYGLPSDWVRTVSVHDNDAGRGTIEYKEETQDGQNVLLCSATDVYLRYVSRVTDPNRMPPDFRKTFARLLAAEMAIDLTASNSIQQACLGESERFLTRAKSADAKGSTPERRPFGSWVTNRFRSGPRDFL